MRILFLDIDGVLNSDAWFRSKRNKTATNELDVAAVKRLDAIVERTGAKVVISSTWRTGLTREELAAILSKYGFRGEVVDMTPVLRAGEGRNAAGSPTRGDEIQAWLEAQPSPPISYVILDDQTDLGALSVRQVFTTYDHGLLDEHIEQAVLFLETHLEP
ncbi:MAG: HAD domain-containing protein [Polyangiaceae bacterium]